MQIPKIQFSPVKYVPSSNKDEIRALKVLSIFAVGHLPSAKEENHWCLYLQYANKMSVRLDITPSYSEPSTAIEGGSKAFMVISKLPYLYSNNHAKVDQMSVKDNVTVGQIVDFLIAHGRHKYEFNSGGSGCRTWTHNQISLLQENNYITDAQESETAKTDILFKYPSGVESPMIPGAYY